MSVVVPAILNIYQNLLGVQFEEIKDASTWHPGKFLLFSIALNIAQGTCEDAQAFSIWDKDAKDASDFVGYCYLDLLPRGMYFPPIISVLRTESSYIASKYSHAAVWSLLDGYDLPDNKRHYPLAAMVANLAKSTPEKPALMTHGDVVTFFHEMGHVFHNLLSRTKYSRFPGTR